MMTNEVLPYIFSQKHSCLQGCTSLVIIPRFLSIVCKLFGISIPTQICNLLLFFLQRAGVPNCRCAYICQMVEYACVVTSCGPVSLLTVVGVLVTLVVESTFRSSSWIQHRPICNFTSQVTKVHVLDKLPQHFDYCTSAPMHILCSTCVRELTYLYSCWIKGTHMRPAGSMHVAFHELYFNMDLENYGVERLSQGGEIILVSTTPKCTFTIIFL